MAVLLERDYASVVLLFTFRGIALVRNPLFWGKKFWKFPGGKGKETDWDPTQTAQREIQEETGIENVFRDDLHLVREPWEKPSKNGGSHLFHFFAGFVPAERPLVVGPSRTHEELLFFPTWEEVRDCPEVLIGHRTLLSDPSVLADIRRVLGTLPPKL